MTEISRDGKRVYFTNSLYSTWDKQFYPDGVPGAQVMCNVGADGGITLDQDFVVDFGPTTARTRSACRAATARPIRSAIRRPERRPSRVDDATAALWLSVVAIGVYHGLNPAMGWPLAVANGLTRQARQRRSSPPWLPLGAGHLLAMAVVLVPFALLQLVC